MNTSGSESEAGAVHTVLIIGGRPQAAEKAKALGLRVVLLQHKERLTPGQVEAADATILVDYLDPDVAMPLVRAAHQAFGFTRVVSLVDQAMELVGRINDELGLDGTPYEVARRFHDKLAMRQWLSHTGFETVAAAAVHTCDELRAFGEAHGYPVVLKPIDATASRGVVYVSTADEVAGKWDQAMMVRERDDLTLAKFFPIDRFIAEEHLDGVEYSAEVFSFDGHHVVVSFTDKQAEHTVEIGHAEPAVLTPEREALLEEHVVGFLTAMGLRNGVSHVEVRDTSRGPRIIEGHDRVAGDRIMDLVEAVYGVDLEQYAVGWPFRLLPPLSRRPIPRSAAATRFLTAPPGEVVAIEGADEVRAQPGVLGLDITVQVGDTVPVVADNFDRPGQVIVTAETTEEAVKLCASLASGIRIVTRPSAG